MKLLLYRSKYRTQSSTAHSHQIVDFAMNHKIKTAQQRVLQVTTQINQTALLFGS